MSNKTTHPYSWFKDSIINEEGINLYRHGDFEPKFMMGQDVYIVIPGIDGEPSRYLESVIVGIEITWVTRYKVAFPLPLNGTDGHYFVSNHRFTEDDIVTEKPRPEKPGLRLV